jgi:hypothetical protein
MNAFKAAMGSFAMPALLALAISMAPFASSATTGINATALDSKCFPTDIPGYYICCTQLPDGTIECKPGLYV